MGAAILAAAVWTCSGGQEAPPEADQSLVPAGPVTRDAGTVGYDQALKRLTVAEAGTLDGYDRRAFRLYQDADGDGCDARKEALLAQAITVPTVREPGCALVGGVWVSPYDGVRLTDARDVQIDHVVALAEAWRSGADSWEKDRLVAYGSDLDGPGHLVAVSREANRAKSALDPAGWLPPDRTHLCRYLADWVGTKVRWGLTVDEREMRALEAVSGRASGECAGEPVWVG
ncbi:HNH endonuclease family protein [Streptomyces albidoflavus]